jgi:hypothetical protein
MKTIKNYLVLALMLMTVGNAFAFNPDLRLLNGKKIIVKVDNDMESAILSIKDLKGYTFYSESIKKSQNDFLKTFDLSALPNGAYVVEIEGDIKVYSFEVVATDTKVESAIEGKKLLYKPLANARGKKVYINKYNPELAPLSVTIYNNNDVIVYSETLEATDNLGRIYNFSKASGDYKIAMSSNEKTYYQTVSIK